MGKLKEMELEIIELIRGGFWPVDIEKMTGFPMEMILRVEEDFYEMNNPRNYGPDYDE